MGIVRRATSLFEEVVVSGEAGQLLLTACTIILRIVLVTLTIILPVQEKNKNWICAGYVLVDIVAVLP